MLPPPTVPMRWRQAGTALAIPVVVAAIGLAYASAHLAWYRGTALGTVPVLDEYENLALAESIVRGELPAEPFYRAMGYPLLLAAIRVLGVETRGLFGAALVLGTTLHALNAGLSAAIAGAWFGRGAAIAAGLLIALNPVFVHYATQALDATPALTLFLAGLACIAPACTANRGNSAAASRWVAVSLGWAAASALRPNYLLAWAVLPLLAGWLGPRGARLRLIGATLAGVIVFGGIAAWQWRASGVPGFLPWQGAYNLWAANRPGTHGRYFAQSVHVPASVATLNFARAESIYLFRQDTGAAPKDIGELNAHWRLRFIAHVTGHPLSWLGLLARKAYALLNDWEQYNNKTYAFHKARSPWLRWNPLGWGILFVFAIAGGARLTRENPAAARFAAASTLMVAAGVLLFFVSARFRLPLAAIAAILAGAALAAPRFWHECTPRFRLGLGLAMLTAAGLTFSRLDHVRSKVTFVEDHMLIAHAAHQMHDFPQTWTEANAALELVPQHRNALGLAVAAYFKAIISTGAGPGPESRWLELSRRFLALDEPDQRDMQALAVIALWRAGERAEAVNEWRRLGATPTAMAARLLVNDRTMPAGALAALPPAAWSKPLVLHVANHLGIAPPPGVKPGDVAPSTEVLRRLFAPEMKPPD